MHKKYTVCDINAIFIFRSHIIKYLRKWYEKNVIHMFGSLPFANCSKWPLRSLIQLWSVYGSFQTKLRWRRETEPWNDFQHQLSLVSEKEIEWRGCFDQHIPRLGWSAKIWYLLFYLALFSPKRPNLRIPTSTLALKSSLLFASPPTFDWRTLGRVTPIKDQGSDCGACWAFASTAQY